MLVFVVPRAAIHAAIGRDNSNLKKLSDILGKRIRVLAQPTGSKDLMDFVTMLVSPIQFEKLDVVENHNAEKEAVITTSGRESKAMLIGRERAREAELKEILHQYFHIKNLKIL